MAQLNMDKLSICRICLAEDGLTSITNTVLEDLYEKLTSTPFQRDDRRPLQVCYICRARLQNCYRLQTSCLQSEVLFTQVLGKYNIVHLLDKNSFKIVHPVIHYSYAPVTRELRDFARPNMDPLGIVDDNVQVKEENVEAAQDDTINMDHTRPEDIVKTEDDGSSYNILVSEAEYTSPYKSLELNVEVDTEAEHVQSMEPQDDFQSDHSTASTEFSDAISIKPVKIVLNKVDLDSIKTGTLAARKLKPDLLKEITQSTAQTETRYQQFSYKVKTMDKTLVDQNIVCNPRQLNKHTGSGHTGKKPYSCDICHKCFNRKSNLTRHVRLHTGEKPFSCDICKKCFIQKHHLISHTRVHTGDKPYSCDICKKRFIMKSTLTNHIRVHTSKKLYICDICKKCLSQKSHLRRHIRLHTVEKSYSCAICKKCFDCKGHLRRHIRVHTGEKPYSCDICKKRFSQKCHLQSHTYTHR